MKVFAAFLLATTLMALVANAQVGLPWPGPGMPASSGATYTGPGDIATRTHWYGVRAYSAAAATAGANAMILCTPSDASCETETVNSAGNLALGAVGATCNNTTVICTVKQLYDQVGTLNISDNTISARPIFVTGCIGSIPCLQGGASALLASATNFTPTTGVLSLTAVGQRVSGTGVVLIIGPDATNNRMAGGNGVANVWFISGSSGSISTSSSVTTDGVTHAANAVINGASSVFNVDGSGGATAGTEATGTVTGSTTAGTTRIAGAASTTMNWEEVGYTDATAQTLTIRSQTCWNQSQYYGTTAGTHCNAGGT